jgi:hypothetical protein
MIQNSDANWTYQLAFNLSLTVLSWPLYIGGQVSRIGRGPTWITISTYNMNSYLDLTLGPSLMGLRGTQPTGSIIYTLVTYLILISYVELFNLQIS